MMDELEAKSNNSVSPHTTTAVRSDQEWESAPPSLVIVETIADLEQTTPIGLSIEQNLTLNDYLDPDALDTLVTSASEGLMQLTLQIRDYTVQIDDTEIVVERVD